MRRGVLAVYLLALMTLAGCLGPQTASWGSDGVEVDFSQDGTTISSDLGASSIEYEDILPVGCEVDGTNYLSTDSSSPISFTGFLASSYFYESHDSINGAKNLDLAVTTSVAIQSMSFDKASEIVEGDGARVDLEDWFMPLDPQTRAGTIDLDEIDGDSDDYWYILGLIPTTENIHDGMRSLDEWHQPVTIEGYLVNPIVNISGFGYFSSGNSSSSHSVDSECNLVVGDDHRQSVYVLVDKIILDDAVVSDDGDSKDEWAYGDVPFFGRAGFILFFLIVGVGGGFGLFILSQLFVLHGAKSTMKTLLGKEGMEKIKKVASDLRRSKAMGMISPKERTKKLDREAKEEKKEQQKSKKPSKKEESAISGFDLDSVLSSSPSKGNTSEFGSSSSSVVATPESMEIDKAQESRDYETQDYTYQKEEKPAWQPPERESRTEHQSSNVVSSEPVKQKREHFSSVAPNAAKSPPAVKKKKTVRKRKSVKKAQAEPAPEQEPKKNSFSEDDDFSDFSM
ncbi:MAG: hypothetical protein QF479_07645 [Candidatus Poseidoniaceae archaeon]|nr:hypothetical protein [Candidatus Poseidoniaceae archaeon]